MLFMFLLSFLSSSLRSFSLSVSYLFVVVVVVHVCGSVSLNAFTELLNKGKGVEEATRQLVWHLPSSASNAGEYLSLWSLLELLCNSYTPSSERKTASVSV